MKEKPSKVNHRMNPVSGKDTGFVDMEDGASGSHHEVLNSTMTVQEQQMAEIMSQSQGDWADRDVLRWRSRLNKLLGEFNFAQMDLEDSARVYDSCKNSEEEKGIQILAEAVSQQSEHGRDRNSSDEEGMDSASQIISTGSKRKRIGVSRHHGQKLPPISEQEVIPSNQMTEEMDTLDTLSMREKGPCG